MSVNIPRIRTQRKQSKNNGTERFTVEEFYIRNDKSQKEIIRGKLVDHKTVKARYSNK